MDGGRAYPTEMFLRVLEAGAPRSRSQQGWFLLGWLKAVFSLCCHTFSLGAHPFPHPSPSSYKGTSFIGVGPHPDDLPMTSSKALPPNTVPLGVRASLSGSGGDTVQPIAPDQWIGPAASPMCSLGSSCWQVNWRSLPGGCGWEE